MTEKNAVGCESNLLPTTNEDAPMNKLFATLIAAAFAAATVTPVIAQDKKDAPKAEAKKTDGKAMADDKKTDGKAKAEEKKADKK
jgi:uncharacterized membrane protein YqiK